MWPLDQMVNVMYSYCVPVDCVIIANECSCPLWISGGNKKVKTKVCSTVEKEEKKNEMRHEEISQFILLTSFYHRMSLKYVLNLL